MLLLSIGIASVPILLLHHHSHTNDCDVAENIPNKFKKEKDHYPKHYHTFEKECFLCFETHFSNAIQNSFIKRNITRSLVLVYSDISSFEIQNKYINLKGRSPPIFSLS